MSPEVRGLNKAFLNNKGNFFRGNCQKTAASVIIRLKREVKPDKASKNAKKRERKEKVSATV